MESSLCQHCTYENITYNIAGRKVYRDQCLKCYDDPVSPKKIYNFYKKIALLKWIRRLFKMFRRFLP